MSAAQTPPPPPAAARLRWLRLGVVLAILALVACRWDSRTGLTALIRFGDDFAARRLPSVASLPVASVPGAGYDGQFYAQLAVEPDVRRPEVQAALDAPAYRAQRILLPLLAHLAVRPWWVLHAFVLLSLGAWMGFALLWWREAVELAPARAPWVWIAGVLSLGALDSLRFSLVDLPATLAVLLAVRRVRTGGTAGAAGWLAAAGLTRETALLALPGLADSRDWRQWGRAALAAGPALAWFVWLHAHLPASAGGFTGNFGWPGLALGAHLVRCGTELVHGNLDSRYLWGLIGGAGLAFQSVHLLAFARSRWPDPWVRAGSSFAILLWVLGPYVWHGYWAAARACLPLTLAFNLTLPAGRGFWWRFLLGNACLLHALYRFIPAL